MQHQPAAPAAPMGFPFWQGGGKAAIVFGIKTMAQQSPQFVQENMTFYVNKKRTIRGISIALFIVCVYNWTR